MKFQKALLMVLFVICMGMTASAATERTREEKIKLHDILYGEDVPVEKVIPALAPEKEADFETEQETEQEPSGEIDIFRKYADLFQGDEKLYLPEAIKKLDEFGQNDEDTSHYREMLQKLIACQGTYIQDKDEQSTGSVYTAEVEIFLKNGIPTCIVDYTNYVGYLEEAEIAEATNEEYAFETHPYGMMGSGDIVQEFFIEFDEENMHLLWAEGSIEYHLKKASGDASELEGDTIPFVDTELYQTLVDKIDEMGDLEHQVSYDDEKRTFYIYIVLSKNGRQKALNNASQMKETWDSVLESFKPITEKISTALTMATREGMYDFQDAHCVLMIVDELNDANEYYPQDIWAVIQDGKTDYDFLSDGSSWSVDSQGSTSTGADVSASGGDSTDTWSNSEQSSNDYSYPASSGERNALQKAKDYLSIMHFSYQGLVDQLEYEGYSYSEATYGADHCGADWYEQAAGKAKDYLDIMSFSYDGLVEQLEFEGFTHDQAVYGANKSY